jgi:iron complex outermembrane receptor protein
MKKSYLLFIFFCFISIWCFSQNSTINGIVTDANTGEPLIGVSIKTQSNAGTVTNSDGKYILKLMAGSYTIIFSLSGYSEKKLTITLTENETRELNISLGEANKELETVVISAGKYEQKLEDITVSMSVMKSDLIENKNTLNCETIIEQIPGVTQQDGQVSIRGGSGFAYGAGSRVLLLVDEMPLLSADANDIKWNTLPVENIEQIEVIKGASSVLFGSSALNGAINIRTAYPKDKPLTKINISQGIYDNPQRDSLKWWDKNPYYTGLNFLHSRKIKNLDLIIGGAAYSDLGYRMGEEEHRGRINFNLRWRSKKINGLSYGVNGNGQCSKSGIFILWQSSSQGYIPQGGADINNPSSTLSINYGTRINVDPFITYYTKKGFKHTLRTRMYYVENVNNTQQSAVSRLYFGEYQFYKKFKNELNLTMGTAGFTSNVNSELFGTHYNSNIAAYTQVDKKFGKLNISAGMRFEYFRLDSTETVSTYKIIRGNDTTTFPVQPVFRAGATYKLFEQSILRASFGQGYRYPSIAEKYVNTSVGALKIFPNENLQAETGWSAELGLKQGIKIHKWMGYLDIAGFITEYDNMMEFQFGVYNPPGTQVVFLPQSHPYHFSKWIGFSAVNAEKARISGIDVQLIGKGKISVLDVAVFCGYTYMNPITLNTDSAYRATFSDPESNILKYRYKHLAKADIQLDYKGWSTGFSMRYNSGMYNIDKSFEQLTFYVQSLYFNLNDAILPGLPQYRRNNKFGAATVFDYRLSYNLNEHARVALIINNLFNKEYMGRPGDIQAPRTFAVQFALKF